MDNIYNIKYIDASYLKNFVEKDKLTKTRLIQHDAYGYVKKNKDNILISFIKEVDNDENVLTLIIPDVAVKSKSLVSNFNIVDNIKIGLFVEIEWRDIVFTPDKFRDDCSVMVTSGILYRIELDHIVIEKPETIRRYPKSNKRHPEENPSFYIIPKAFINSIKIKDDRKNSKK